MGRRVGRVVAEMVAAARAVVDRLAAGVGDLRQPWTSHWRFGQPKCDSNRQANRPSKAGNVAAGWCGNVLTRAAWCSRGAAELRQWLGGPATLYGQVSEDLFKMLYSQFKFKECRSQQNSSRSQNQTRIVT